MNIPVEIVVLFCGAWLAMQGWALWSISDVKETLAKMKQQIRDLPCIHCNPLTLGQRNDARQKALDDNAAAA